MAASFSRVSQFLLWNNRAHRIVPAETRRNEHQPNRKRAGERVAGHVEAVLSLETRRLFRAYTSIHPPFPIVSGRQDGEYPRLAILFIDSWILGAATRI